jgi:hypothetical protein
MRGDVSSAVRKRERGGLTAAVPAAMNSTKSPLFTSSNANGRRSTVQPMRRAKSHTLSLVTDLRIDGDSGTTSVCLPSLLASARALEVLNSSTCVWFAESRCSVMG